MNTHTDATPSSDRLRTVRQLLEQLGSMKAEGLGVRERLDFLQSQGPELVKDFSFEDAFDADARASSARVAQLEDLSSRAVTFETAWRAAPISSDVREAGSKLFKLVKGFIQDAQESERNSEIDMLGQLWKWGPDISHVYPELTGRKSKSSRPENVQLADGEPFDMSGNQELEHATDELQAEITQENLERLWPGADKLEKVAAVKQESLDGVELTPAELTAQLEKKTREFDSGTHIRRDFPVKEAQASVRSPRLEKEEEPSQDDSRLRQDAWTDAIREVTLAPWRFHLEASSHVGGRGMGTSMVWKLGGDEAAYIKLETSRGRELECHVRLEWTNPKIRIRALERELTEAGLVDLHLDPVAFVTELLGEE